jgi:hypothetical protein
VPYTGPGGGYGDCGGGGGVPQPWELTGRM